jgi:hypothetical protein
MPVKQILWHAAATTTTSGFARENETSSKKSRFNSALIKKSVPLD